MSKKTDNTTTSTGRVDTTPWTAAFPVPQGRHECGMSLRDYFAGQYVAQEMAHGDEFDTIAKEAYEFSDAMMKERGHQ